ncbi:MAG: hypothetical protein HY747_01795 [Elusimicrobia bacterium]|nr:hypothetical protein [Elusimicrobiota bacterium]
MRIFLFAIFFTAAAATSSHAQSSSPDSGSLNSTVSVSCLTVSISNPNFDDSDVRIDYYAQNLWRDSSGAFVGTIENGKLVLIYDFFEDSPSDPDHRQYFKCPAPSGPGSADYPNCETMQNAVIDSMNKWAEASRWVILKQKSADNERVNIFIAWTKAFAANPQEDDNPLTFDISRPPPPFAKVIDNSQDANYEKGIQAARDFHGFSRPGYPSLRKEFSTLLFNADYCWYLDDESVCPPAPTLPNGSVALINKRLAHFALHESGHVFGFNHFTRRSSVHLAGGTDFLTDYDQTAVRILYDMVKKSLMPNSAPPKNRRH